MIINNDRLIRVSLLISIIGIIIISMLTKNTLTYEEFIKADENIKINIVGNITTVKIINNNTFVSINTKCEIPGVIFNKINISKGNNMIIGQKKYYKGKPEIIIEDIHPINLNNSY